MVLFIAGDDPDFAGLEISEGKLQLPSGRSSIRCEIGNFLMRKPFLGILQYGEERDLGRERGVAQGGHGEGVALLGPADFLLAALYGFLAFLLDLGVLRGTLLLCRAGLFGSPKQGPEGEEKQQESDGDPDAKNLDLQLLTS